jgi:hypothetical protein
MLIHIVFTHINTYLLCVRRQEPFKEATSSTSFLNGEVTLKKVHTALKSFEIALSLVSLSEIFLSLPL